MIRAACNLNSDKTPAVLLGLDAQNLNRLREGQPICVNLRQLDPDGPPVAHLPDVDIIIFYGGTDETRALIDAYHESR